MTSAREHNELVGRILEYRLLTTDHSAARAVGRFQFFDPNLSPAEICRAAVDAFEIALDHAAIADAGGGLPRGIMAFTMSELDPHRANMAQIFMALIDEPVSADEVAIRFGITADKAEVAFKNREKLRGWLAS
ncbi:hypothetical protein QBK99_05330 [Corticibacterium sp. UT-5YL-CI-8]|nr:hypothetical protein [Tianweitania sp. UT-5YL-CI-8]